MKRELYVSTPSVQNISITVPVNKGGTGGTTSTEVAASLSGLLTANIGLANGPVKQEVGGGVAKAALPSAIPLGATMNGPQDLYVGTTNTLAITNYDANTTYAVSASAGTISINGSNVTYVAPATPQAVTLNIGGRQITANVIALAPYRPTINVPVYGATGQAAIGLQIQGSALQVPSGAASHQQSDWQLATDSAFNNIVQSSTNDTVNKTTWTPSNLSYLATYYVRARYKDTNLGYSNWSNGEKFTTQAVVAITTEEAKLLAGDPAASDNFGYSVSMSSDGSRVIVGAQSKTGSFTVQGAAYVFSRSGSTWTQEAKLLASDPGQNNRFGVSVSMSSDGSRVVIGAYGKTVSSFGSAGVAYIFLRTNTTWAQESELTASDPAASDTLGRSVSISSDGSRVIAGAPAKTNTASTAGAAYIFLRTGTTWAQEQKLLASDPATSDNFGISVSISGDGTRAMAGAYQKTNGSFTIAGAAYIFLRSGTTWAQEQKLLATDSASNDQFGWSVSMNTDGSRAVIGAVNKTSTLSVQGAAYIFLRIGTSWSQEAKLLAGDPAASDKFGISVSMNTDGSRVVIGAYQKTNGSFSTAGAAYVFLRTGTTWAQESKILASDPAASDQFGWSVSITSDGTRVASGAYNKTGTAGTAQGAVYIDR